MFLQINYCSKRNSCGTLFYILFFKIKIIFMHLVENLFKNICKIYNNKINLNQFHNIFGYVYVIFKYTKFLILEFYKNNNKMKKIYNYKIQSNIKMESHKFQNGLVYDEDIIYVRYDFYALYKWPETQRIQTIVEGEIKYFRIGLNYSNLSDLKSICKINISYVKKGDKCLSLFKTNIYDFYKYLIKYYEEVCVINYLKKIYNKFYIPKIKNVTIEEVDEVDDKVIHKEYIINITEINVLPKKYKLPKIIIENNNYLYNHIPQNFAFEKKI